MKKLILFIVFAFALLVSINAQANAEPSEMMLLEEAIPIDYDATKTTAVINTTFDTIIGNNNIEKSNYKIHIKNLENKTAEITINLNWQIKPQKINATIDGTPITIIKESEYYDNTRYKIQTDILPESEKTIDIAYTILKTPNRWNVGLWALDYNYNTPINIYLNYKTNDYTNTKITYSGNIAFDYPPYKPACTNCIYENGIVKVNNANYFYLNWQKKRTPVRAGIVYFVMFSAIIYYLIKKRKTQ